MRRGRVFGEDGDIGFVGEVCEIDMDWLVFVVGERLGVYVEFCCCIVCGVECLCCCLSDEDWEFVF